MTFASRDDAARFLAGHGDQQVRQFAIYALTGHANLRQQRYNRAASAWLSQNDSSDAEPETRMSVASFIVAVDE